MPYRKLYNGVQREDAKPVPDLAFELLSYVPLHNILYCIFPILYSPLGHSLVRMLRYKLIPQLDDLELFNFGVIHAAQTYVI